MSKNRFYLIRVLTQIDPAWSDWFDGFTITSQPDGETVIAGLVRDQAELNGLLNKLFTLNLVVVDLRSKADPPDETK